MALTLKTLRQGLVKASGNTLADRTLYPTAQITGKNALVKNIIFTNTHTSTVTLTVWVRSDDTGAAATISYIAPKPVSIAPGASMALTEELTLDVSVGTPVKITAEASVVDVVTFLVNGMERDV